VRIVKEIKIFHHRAYPYGVRCALCDHVMVEGEPLVLLPIDEDVVELQCNNHPNIPTFRGSRVELS
jgi:hypothetical protein